MLNVLKMDSNNKTLGTSNFRHYFSTDTIGITFILIVSFVLRFYHFNQIPFNSDELSAIYRARFDTLSELINKGVLIDGHPAGVQVFLYYWIKCFGTSEFIVKLPFMIMGVLSVYLTYRIAQKWFNSTVALIASAYVSTLQLTVMFSQIARPYSSGLFLALLMVWFWTNFIFDNTTKKTNYYLAGFIIAGALNAYNHHFNLLFLLIVSITGLFFINKQKLKLYLLGGIAIFVLYIPHLHIFFYQLKVGGVGGKDGWLAAPEYNFLYEYLKFIFHYSKLEIIFTLFITLAGIVLFFKNSKTIDKTKIKFIIISFVWFLLPLIIGFYYSRTVAPVLQYSVMIFTFPFLLIGMFSFFPELGKYLKIGLISLILFVNIYTLTIERKYYQLFYHQGYRECACQINEIYKQYHKNIPVLVNGYGDFFMEYYEKLFNTKFNCVHFNIDTVNALKFSKLVKAQSSDELILAAVVGTPSSYCDIIKETYPYLIKKSLGYGYEMFYFSKQFSKDQNQKYIPINNPRIKLENKKEIHDTSYNHYSINGKYYFYFNKDIEFGADYTTPIFKISNKYNNLHISFYYYPKDTTTNPLLVICTEDKNGKSINWQGIPLKTLFTSDSLSQKIYYSVGLVNFNLKNKDTILKIFIWNKDKDTFDICDVNIWTEEGNRYVYSLYYDFK